MMGAKSKGLKVEKSKGQKVEKGENLDSSTFRPLDPKIRTFLKKHHVLTLATSKDNIPWVAHCFYAFLEEEMCLVFTTDDATRHGEEMRDNSRVSVGIAWETKIIGQIRGAQVSGFARKVERSKGSKGSKSLKVERSKGSNSPKDQTADFPTKVVKTAYLKRFPYTALMKTSLWVIEIDTIKYTDNRLGFGKKLLWQHGDELVTLDRDV